MRIKLTNALSLPHPQNKKRVVLRHAGEVVEVDDKVGQRALEMGAAEEVEQDGDSGDLATELEKVAADQGVTGSVDEKGSGDSGDVLPARPANGAPTAKWQAYLEELQARTDDLGPIEVPEGARRDDLIRLGDERVAEWDEHSRGAEV
jgi:hypothetical protein